MLVFIVRRLIISLFVLLAATFLIYNLVAMTGDPLSDLRTDPSPDRQQKIDSRIRALDLDTPAPLRYFKWLSGVGQCLTPFTTCSLGQDRMGQDVVSLLELALKATVQLVIVAAVVAMILGIFVGVVTALRQYSLLDYSVTFIAFLFFAVPVFWAAVMFKKYGIRLNDWLIEPTIPAFVLVLLSALSGVSVMAIIGAREKRKKWIHFGIGAVAMAGVLYYLSATEWFRQPSFGPVVIFLMCVGSALIGTLAYTNIGKTRTLYATMATALAGFICYFACQPVLTDPTWAHILMLIGITAVVCVAIGYFVGGTYERRQAMKASTLTGLFISLAIFFDRMLVEVPLYSDHLGGRVFSTAGEGTPNFSGTFWEELLDIGFHLILPTCVLILASFAAYSRFTRSSMLEVMNLDYVRTARAKGLTERSVVTRHALRNALLPVITLIASDFAGLLGGAVMTEVIFSRKGMGSMFVENVQFSDLNPVMASILITATGVVIFNMLADITYARLDPRIRL